MRVISARHGCKKKYCMYKEKLLHTIEQEEVIFLLTFILRAKVSI